jgi:hypothetical protein
MAHVQESFEDLFKEMPAAPAREDGALAATVARFLKRAISSRIEAWASTAIAITEAILAVTALALYIALLVSMAVQVP